MPFPSPGDLPDPGIEPMSLALRGRFFTAEPTGKPLSENVLGEEGILPFGAYYEHNQKPQLCLCGQKLLPVRFIPIKRAIIYEEKMIRVFHITSTVFRKLKGSRREADAVKLIFCPGSGFKHLTKLPFPPSTLVF